MASAPRADPQDALGPDPVDSRSAVGLTSRRLACCPHLDVPKWNAIFFRSLTQLSPPLGGVPSSLPSPTQATFWSHPLRVPVTVLGPPLAALGAPRGRAGSDPFSAGGGAGSAGRGAGGVAAGSTHQMTCCMMVSTRPLSRPREDSRMALSSGSCWRRAVALWSFSSRVRPGGVQSQRPGRARRGWRGLSAREGCHAGSLGPGTPL